VAEGEARRDRLGRARENARLDAANLGKVIEGKGKPSRALLAHIETLRSKGRSRDLPKLEATPLDQGG
jgi:hypothetical protein